MESQALPRLLLVDDDPSHLDITASILCNEYRITATTRGEEALKLACEQRFDAILLDVVMPDMDGFEVCSSLLSKANFSTPIVFLTSSDSAAQIERGLELGATYYLTKPINPKRLKAVIRTATEHAQSLFQVEDKFSSVLQTLSLLDSAVFKFKTLSEARSLASLVAEISPNPDNVRLGLNELLINAIEHGNLGISYEEKSALNEDGIWEDEVNIRLENPELAKKTATLQIVKSKTYITFIISDEGDGFEWENYLSFDPDRAFHSHGRGIAMAKMVAFDSLEYQGNGSSVKAAVKLT